MCIDVLLLVIVSNYYGMWRLLDGVPPPKKTKTDETIKEKNKEYEKTTRVRKFQDNWKIERTWLTYSKADNKMFCDICKRHNVTSRNIINKNTGRQSTLSVFVSGSSNVFYINKTI